MSFVTQLKIEFLLPFTSCRKVLGKMPANVLHSSVLKFFEFAAAACSKVKTEMPEMQTWQAAIQSCSYK